jgi:hypothetical protein
LMGTRRPEVSTHAPCDLCGVGGDARPGRGPLRARLLHVASWTCPHGRLPRGRPGIDLLRQRRGRLRHRVRPDRRLGTTARRTSPASGS